MVQGSFTHPGVYLRKIVCLFFIFSCIAVFSQPNGTVTLTWAQGVVSHTNTGGNIRATKAAVLSGGDVVISGTFAGVADLDPSSTSAFNLAARSSTGNVFFARYTSSGQFVFAKQLEGTEMGMATGLAVDTADNIYLSGNFKGITDFDPSSSTATLQAQNGQAFFAKYSSSGVYIFAKTFTTNLFYLTPVNIALDQAANIWLSAQFAGTVDADPSTSVTTVTAVNLYDILVSKFTAAGGFIMAFSIGGTGTEGTHAVACDASGNVYVGGHFTNEIDLDPSSSTSSLSAYNGDDMFFAKYNSNGAFQFVDHLLGNGSGYIYDMTCDQGAIYITGTYNGSIDFNPSSSATNSSTASGDDFFVAKYTLSGAYNYASFFGMSGFDNGVSVATDAAGNCYVGGHSATGTSLATYSIVLSKYSPSGSLVYRKLTPNQTGLGTMLLGANSVIYLCGYFLDETDLDFNSSAVTFTAPHIDSYLSKYDSTGSLTWAASLGGYHYVNHCSPKQVKRDAAGNTYVTGLFSGNYDFGGGNYLNSLKYNDAFLAKYNVSGGLVYAHHLKGLYQEQGWDVAIDAVGAVYLTGSFTGVVDFDFSSSTYTLSAPAAGMEMFFAKYDASGNFIFAKHLSGGSGSFAESIIVDGSGNIYVAGDLKGTVDLDPSSSTANISSGFSAGSPNFDGFFAKYDASGNYLFSRKIGSSTGLDGVQDMLSDSQKNIYVTGSFGATVDFDPSSAVYNLTPLAFSNVYFAKYDSLGAFVMAKALTGSQIFYTQMALDTAGNIILGGAFNNTVDFDPSTSSYTLASSSGADIYLAKYNSQGALQFAKQINGTSYQELIRGIAVDNSGSIYVTGEFDNTLDFDPSSSVFSLTSPGTNKRNAFLAKYDNQGGLQYATGYGLSNDDYGYSVVADLSGNIVTFAGTFYDTLDAQPGAGVFNLISPAPVSGMFVATYSSCSGPAAPVVLTPSANLRVCPNSVVSLSVSGVNVSWYSSPTSTTSIGSGTSFSASMSAAGSYSYYASDAGICFPSSRSAIVVTVDAIPTVTAAGGTICYGNSFTITPSGAATYSISSGAYVVSPTVSTTYSVTGMSAAGCQSSNTAVVMVSVSPLPTVAVNSGSVCSGSSFVLVPSGAAAYSVTGGTFTVTPSVNTSYSVTGVSAQGCISSNTAVANVLVQALPVVTAGGGTICAGEDFVVVPAGAVTYTIAGNTFTLSPPAGVTTYTVAGTGAGGCVSAPINVTVTAYARPILTVNSGSICAGDTFFIQASGAPVFSISGGSNQVAPPFSTTYTITGSSAEGCVALTPAISSVTVVQLPAISAAGGSICAGQTFTIQASGAQNYTYSSGVNVVSPQTTTTYSVWGSNATCVSATSSPVQVVVLPLPVISVASGSVCSGESFALAPSGASSFIYFNGGPVVSPGTTAYYNVAGIGNNGCQSVPVTATVVVNPLPFVFINVSDSLVCVGESASLQGSGAAAYLWSSGATTQNLSVSPASTTVYSLTGFSSEGCKGYAAYTLTVDNCTALYEATSAQGIFVYPNPNCGQFNVTVEGKAACTVSDVLGQIVLYRILEIGNNELDLGDVDNGLYNVTIEMNGKLESVKLLKQQEK